MALLLGRGKNSKQAHYKVQDDTYRDVFNEKDRKKAKRRTVTPRWPNFAVAIAFFVVMLLIYVYGGAWIYPHAIKFFSGTLLGNFDAQLPPGTYSFWLNKVMFSGFSFFMYLLDLGVSFMIFEFMDHNWRSQNLGNTAEDINDHEGDSRVMQPYELPKKFDVFPDAGAHSPLEVTAVLSHMMLSNKGLKKVKMTQFHDKAGVDSDGEPYVKGEEIYDDETGDLVQKTVPLIDEKFGQDLFNASDMTNKQYQKTFDAPRLEYNPDNQRGKKKGEKTLADHINQDWTLPDYETQRPAGAYIVDTSPANTMV